MQQQILEETLKSIILASGCQDVISIADDSLKYFSNEDVQEQVEEYIGTKNYIAFIGLIAECNNTVKKVARNISGLVPAYKDPTDDLVAIIHANHEKPSLVMDLAPRVKLLLGITDMKTTIDEIDDGTAALERFARVIMSNRQIIQNTTSRAAVKLSRALRHIRAFAGSLYTAILDGFQQQDPKCHEEHEMRLYLEDRVDLASDLLRRMGNASSIEAPLMFFDIVFTASTAGGDRVFYETPVQVFSDGNGHDSFNLTANMNQVRLQKPKIHSRQTSSNGPPPLPNDSQLTLVLPESRSRSPSPGYLTQHMVVSVANICTELTKAKDGERRVSFALVSNGGDDGDKPRGRRESHIETIDVDANRIRELSGVSTMSLGELLAADPKTAAPLSWKFRMRLALRLASSLLQLLQTQWLCHVWSKDLVFFLVTPLSSTSKGLKVDLGRPFVACTFDRAHLACESEMASRNMSIEPKVALLELGILLLEIWHRRTLEDRFGLEVGKAPKLYYDRMARAVEWLDDVRDPLPDLYEQAVAHCLRVNVSGDTRFLDWEETKLWDVVCGDIIEPLSKICKQWSE